MKTVPLGGFLYCNEGESSMLWAELSDTTTTDFHPFDDKMKSRIELTQVPAYLCFSESCNVFLCKRDNMTA